MELTEKKNKIGPWVVAILGILYGVSPVDLLPDVVPGLGWVDDLVISGGAILHLTESYVKEYNASLSYLIRMVKWLLWIGGGILVLLLMLLGVATYSLFTS